MSLAKLCSKQKHYLLSTVYLKKQDKTPPVALGRDRKSFKAICCTNILKIQLNAKVTTSNCKIPQNENSIECFSQHIQVKIQLHITENFIHNYVKYIVKHSPHCLCKNVKRQMVQD